MSSSREEESNVKYNLAILLTALSLSAMLSDAAAPSQTLPAASKTPPSSSEALVFSRTVTGSWSQTVVAQCDFNSRTGKGRATLAGTVSGGSWTFSLDIGSYRGPGNYDAKKKGNVAVVLGDGSHNPNTHFTSTGSGSASITVAANEKSGTVEALLWSDTGQSVRISGSWRC
jgi:hypothetical protein